MLSNVPQHVGFIMDGNRRWAKAHGLRPVQGHEQGVKTLKEIIRFGTSAGVKVMTAFVFSTENWKRSKDEVRFLMRLIVRVFKNELDEFIKDGYKIVILGSRENISKTVLDVINQTEARTKNNTRGTIALCFNYSAEQELADAAAQLTADALNGGQPKPLRSYLYHPEIPDLDLIVRTSGEQRLSGFMLPRANYAELAFTPVHWPDFSAEEFKKILVDYADRQRRFGR